MTFGESLQCDTDCHDCWQLTLPAWSIPSKPFTCQVKGMSLWLGKDEVLRDSILTKQHQNARHSWKNSKVFWIQVQNSNNIDSFASSMKVTRIYTQKKNDKKQTKQKDQRSLHFPKIPERSPWETGNHPSRQNNWNTPQSWVAEGYWERIIGP